MNPVRQPGLLPGEPASIPLPRFDVDDDARWSSAWSAARGAAGVSLIIGFVVLAALAVLGRPVAAVLPATALASVMVAAAVAVRRLRSGDVACDGRLDDGLDERRRAVANALFFAGLALVAPLTMHGLLQPWRWAPLVDLAVDRDHTFRAWVVASLWYVGHTHIVFAVLCGLRGLGGPSRPRLRTIGIAAVLVTLLDVLLWSIYGLLPAAYVAVSVVPLLFGLRFLERRLQPAIAAR